MAETGIKQLDDFLFSKLNIDNCMIKKNIAKANYFNGSMNTKNCYVDISNLSAQDYSKACDELLIENNSDEVDLESFFINRFGKTIYRKIAKPVSKKYMGIDPSLLSEKAGSFFDLSRVLAFDDVTTRVLVESESYNLKLGHHNKSKGVNKFYPKEGGMGGLIDLLLGKLNDMGVNIKLSTNIKYIIQENGKVLSLFTDEQISTDNLVWTLPSSYLSSLCGLDRKISPPKFRNTAIFDFTFEKALNSMATFINVYDVKMLSGRVTLYQNLSQPSNYSYSVEVLADDCIDLDTVIDSIQNELTEMGIVKKGNQCIFKHYRPLRNGFPILTKELVESQCQLSEYCENFFQNVTFIGRSTGKVFFTSEMLVDTFKKITG